MSWARLDDGTDEELSDLGHEAFRLYVCALTYNRRRQLGGVMTAADVAHLRHAQRVRQSAVDELIESDRWERGEHETTVIRNYERFNPLSSTERVRKHRVTRPSVSSSVSSALLEHSGNTPSRARPRAGYPKPTPIPSPTTLSSESVSHARPVIDHPAVQAYLGAARAAQIPDAILARNVGQVHANAVELIAEGASESDVVCAAADLGRRGGNPNLLHVDVDRHLRKRGQSIEATTTAASARLAAEASA